MQGAMQMSKNDFPSITYREYKFEENFPFLLMHGNQISSHADFIHFHNCIEIALLEKGTMIWNLENKVYTLTPRNILFLPPFFTHASFFPPQDDEEALCHYLFFNPEQLLAPLHPDGLPEELSWYHYTEFSKILPCNQFPDETKMIERIICEATEKRDYFQPIITGLIENLTLYLYRRHQSNPETNENSISLFLPVVSYLDQNFQTDTSNEYLAQLCGLSVNQFLDKFKLSFHQTPKQYIRNVRIRKACHLLTRTENSILEIALQTGFSSLTSFNRSFLAIMGQSPHVFRNEHRAIVKKNLKHAPFDGNK